MDSCHEDLQNHHYSHPGEAVKVPGGPRQSALWCSITSDSNSEHYFARGRSPASFQEERPSLGSNDQEWCLLDNKPHYPAASGLAQVDLALLRSLILLAVLLWVAYPEGVGGCWPWALNVLNHRRTCSRTYVQAASELSSPCPADLTLTPGPRPLLLSQSSQQHLSSACRCARWSLPLI